MIAFAVAGPTPGNDSRVPASAVLMFTMPFGEEPFDATPVEGAPVVVAAAIAWATVATVGFVRRGFVVGGAGRSADEPRDGTNTWSASARGNAMFSDDRSALDDGPPAASTASTTRLVDAMV